MKKMSTRLILLFVALLGMGNSLFATEPVFTINGKNICENSDVEIEITVGDFTDMISFQFTVGWDVTMMQASEVTFINEAVSNDIFFGPFTSESEVLTVSWFDNALTGVNIADDEVLFTISFTVTGDNQSSTMLEFFDSPTMREVSANEPGGIEVVTGIWNEDMVMIDQPTFGDAAITNDIDMAGVGTIDLTVANGEAPYSYSWESGQTTEDLTNLSIGDYSCTVTDNKGCVIMVGPFTVDNTVDVREIEGLQSVTLFPNPATNKANLNVVLDAETRIDINIYNILGEIVYHDQIESANIATDLDLSNLAVGQYIVQLQSNEGMYIEKLQVRR